MSDTPSFTKKPGRQYYQKRPGVTMRVRIPMKPLIPCVIVDLVEKIHISYNYGTKEAFINPHALTVFPSRTEARKALWHICQEISGAVDRYKIEPWGGA